MLLILKINYNLAVETLNKQTMEKLELKHICNYLPYDIKVGIKEDQYKSKYGLRVFGFDMGINDQVTLRVIDDGIKLPFFVNLEDCKPLLLPLSELTQEQWHEVFNFGFNNANPKLPEFWNKKKRTIEFHDNAVELCFENEINNCSYSFDEVMFSTNGTRFNQLAAFNKIHELHGDIENLIGAGLALNKRQHENK